MAETIVIESLEQLLRVFGNDHVLEVVTRGMNHRYKQFQKILIKDSLKSETQELVQSAMNALNQNANLREMNLNKIMKAVKLQQLALVLNGANLCATCAGFAVMYAKIENMGAEISHQIGELNDTVKKGNDLQIESKFHEVLAKYSDMLDCKRILKPYSEKEMRELIDQAYILLNTLIQMLQKDIFGNKENCILSVFSVLSMLTVSLKDFDEIYYFNHRDMLKGEGVWHASHEKWMSIFSVLTSEWFRETLQDYAWIDAGMSTENVDIYCSEFMDQVFVQKQEIEDNQSLILAVDDIQQLKLLREMREKEVKDTVEQTFRDVFDGQERSIAASVYVSAMKQVAIA